MLQHREWIMEFGKCCWFCAWQGTNEASQAIPSNLDSATDAMGHIAQGQLIAVAQLDQTYRLAPVASNEAFSDTSVASGSLNLSPKHVGQAHNAERAPHCIGNWLSLCGEARLEGKIEQF
jgi:hypothetical protein